jgi:AcrR family transcriptional regulator
VKRTQRERSESTIASILAVARALFVRDGYTETSLDEIAAAANVTKGALYHHFSGKQALFRAIYEREQHTIIEAVSRAYKREHDAWSGFQAGVAASLTISCRPDVQRITLIDAPAAIGWETMREIEDRYTMQMLERGLQRVIDEGWIEPRPVASLARFLFGGICELAMVVAHSKQPRKDKTQAAKELTRIVAALAQVNPAAD